jgi:hypothetical protein
MITGSNPSGTASFDYDLVLHFTTPSGGGLSDTIHLAMTATGNCTNSAETLSPFPSLADFSLPGVKLSNFAFVTAGSNTFSNETWTVTRGPGGAGSTAFLDLVANVTAAAPPGVAEPRALVLLGTALAGLFGLSRHRRRWHWRRTGDAV